MGMPLTIEIFTNRLTFTNPGSSLNDVNRLIDLPPHSRNEAMAQMIYNTPVCCMKMDWPLADYTGTLQFEQESDGFGVPHPCRYPGNRLNENERPWNGVQKIHIIYTLLWMIDHCLPPSHLSYSSRLDSTRFVVGSYFHVKLHPHPVHEGFI